MDAQERYYFLPYALDGTIDVYGRFTGVTPLPFNGGAEGTGIGKNKSRPWIKGLIREPIYQEFDEEVYEVAKDKAKNLKCVLLKDYTPQRPEHILSRQIIDESLLDMMSNCIPYMNTALVKSTGVGAIRVNNPDEQSNVDAANLAMKNAALTGKPYIPVVGSLDW